MLFWFACVSGNFDKRTSRYKPAQVFEQVGELETDLINKTRPMLEGLHSILTHVSTTGTFHGIQPATANSFVILVDEYLKSFFAWKKPDEIKMVKRVTTSLHHLVLHQAYIPENNPGGLCVCVC